MIGLSWLINTLELLLLLLFSVNSYYFINACLNIAEGRRHLSTSTCNPSLYLLARSGHSNDLPCVTHSWSGAAPTMAEGPQWEKCCPLEAPFFEWPPTCVTWGRDMTTLTKSEDVQKSVTPSPHVRKLFRVTDGG